MLERSIFVVTVNQVQAGVTRFIDTDILPHLTGVIA
nr:MAG TPA: hypothetical protein [Caudoviricetes sp.]